MSGNVYELFEEGDRLVRTPSGFRARYAICCRRATHAGVSPEVKLMGLGSEPPKQWDGPWINLPRDDVPYPKDADERAGGALHWAPLMHQGMRQRSALTADWLAQSDCQILVADVSVEMPVLARLRSVPTVAVAMRGRRDNRPHALGCDVSRAILAPWPAGTQEPVPDRWTDNLVAIWAFSRFDSLIDDTVLL